MRKRIQSFGHAFRGIYRVFSKEPNAGIHLLAATGVVLMGFYLRISSYEWALVLVAIGVVFSAELFNSSIEALCDKVSPEWDAQIRDAKDLAAGGVLVSAIMAALIGALVFLPYLL